MKLGGTKKWILGRREGEGRRVTHRSTREHDGCKSMMQHKINQTYMAIASMDITQQLWRSWSWAITTLPHLQEISP